MKNKTITLPGMKVVLYCWCLLLAVLVTDALPITSKPLDNNPDHLTWEAAWLSEDNPASIPLGGKTKKITPKSIFITPFLNSYNTSACPPDYKVDYNGKCIQVVSINTADILVTKLQSLFSQHGDGSNNGAGTGEDDYDYDYDSTGPFHVNLPLSIDLPPEPQHQSVSQATPNLVYKDISEPSFYDSAMVQIATVDQDKAKITTVSVSDSEKTSSMKPFLTTSTSSTPELAKVDQSQAGNTHADISFLAFETLANGTLVGQVELEGKNSTVVQNIFVSSTTPDIPMADSGNTTESTVIELASSTGTTTDRSGDTTFTDGDTIASTVLLTQDISTTTTVQGDGSGSNTTEKEEDDATIATDASSIGATSTTEQSESDVERTNLELEEELLLLDSNRSSLAPADPSTTDVFDIDLNTPPTVETLPSDEQSAFSNVPDSDAVRTTISPPVRPYVAIPTKPSVQIITPFKGSWDLGIRTGLTHMIAASHRVQQDRTTRATAEATTLAINVERATQTPIVVAIRQDSLDDRKASHDTQYPPREVHKASNNVVYHNLPASTIVSTTETNVSSAELATSNANSILQVRPLASTPPDSSNNYLEQLRKINEIVTEKRRHQQQQEQLGVGSSSTYIRFPSQDDEQLSGAASHNYQQQASAVRFPGSATNRLTPSSSNRLPDSFPKKSPDSTTQRPAFWWLPSGWEVDQAGNKPMLLRFWSRMPLVRDSALEPTSASPTGNFNIDPIDTAGGTNNNRWRSATGIQQQQQTTGTLHPVATARGNSKSPSENFYKEVSAQEVYKVMNARQLNHHQQR